MMPYKFKNKSARLFDSISNSYHIIVISNIYSLYQTIVILKEAVAQWVASSVLHQMNRIQF